MNTGEMKRINNLDVLLEYAKTFKRRSIAVVGARNRTALAAVLEAERLGLGQAILVGATNPTMKLVDYVNADELTKPQLVGCDDEDHCARVAVNLIRTEAAEILLKGSVDTATLMKAVLDHTEGLRIGHLLSDVFLCELKYPEPKLIMITDGGVTPNPDQEQKVEIIRNAVEVAHALGVACPKVALLSATEKVTPALPSTVDAAVITQMNRRGQIQGCIVDGPLALDLAMSAESAQIKGIDSPVAGQADILVAPNIEVANILGKSTTFFAGLRLAHVIVGARAPILIPSRSDTIEAKLFSIALGVIMSHWKSH